MCPFIFLSSAQNHRRQASPTDSAAAAATQPVLSPVSNVQGVAFNRFIQIWLENTDQALAEGNPDIAYLASQGISLSNFWGLVHPSQGNYLAAAAGDHFGLHNDNFVTVRWNVSTIADVLDTKGIAWAEYMESLPYAGFEGNSYPNQRTNANDYVRKHNPLVLFDSVTGNSTRLSLLKNFTSFTDDLAAKTLPQWAFMSPNMTNNGHDTSIRTAGAWARSFLSPLLANDYFAKDTLILLTFDENEHYSTPNQVFSILLGGAVPKALHGTADATFYTHYSTLATVEANFGLPSLGRWDCGANIFALVANKTGYANYDVDTSNLKLSGAYPGPLGGTTTWPRPATNAKCAAGNGVLAAVVQVWGREEGELNYTLPWPHDDVSGTDAGAKVTLLATRGMPSRTGVAAAATSSGAAGRWEGMGSLGWLVWSGGLIGLMT